MKKPRGILIAGNWKMNHGPAATEAFFKELWSRAGAALPSEAQGQFGSGRLRATVIPPFLSLTRALQSATGGGFPVTVAAQNVHWDKSGAFTGEVSGPMLQEIGIRECLVGHSERRQYFGETDDTARKRTESLLEQGFKVILCIGETRSERESGKTEEVVTRQLKAVLAQQGQGAARFLDGTLVIAYEPVWAIGTGLTASPEQAQEAHEVIRKLLRKGFGDPAADLTPILYGGSVTPQNADTLLSSPDIDGALVGGASLKPESFLALVAAGSRALI